VKQLFVIASPFI